MSSFPIKLGKALFAAQGEMRGVIMHGNNPHFRSRYATLENVTDTIRPVLQSHGVLFMQSPGSVNENGVMDLTTWFIHAESGEIFSSVLGVPLNKRDPQGFGSAITYACRYSLMALLGLPPVDDDGEDAGRAEAPTPAKVLAKKDDKAKEELKNLMAEIAQQISEDGLRQWMKNPKVLSRIATLPVNWQDDLRTELNDALSSLKAVHAP